MSNKLNLNKLEKTFIIAEIGQNHQGDIQLAKQLIAIAKASGANCVKFQKSDLTEKFTQGALDKPYPSVNSFGLTYGDHKKFLEFSDIQFNELKNFADQNGIMFSASAMDIKSLDFLIQMDLPFIKIGSGDANNFQLIENAAKSHIPLIISTGMQTLETTRKIYKTISQYHSNFVLLHCVSAYPTPYEDIHLNVIKLYQNEFPDISIGYSGHELGIHCSTAAVALGAKIIERHITINKQLKGSDHQCSLEPDEFKSMVTNIQSLEIALGIPQKKIQQSELVCYEKLGKTLVYSENLTKGYQLQSNNICVKVAFPKGIDGAQIDNVIGRILTRCVKKDEPLNVKDFLF